MNQACGREISASLQKAFAFCFSSTFFKISLACLVAAGLFLQPAPALAADHWDATQMSLPWVLPFVCMLLSIAIFPLVLPSFWHHHFGKISVFWALAFLVPFAIFYGASTAFHEMLHTILLDYIPFMALLLSLFAVAGGIRLKGEFVGTPTFNTGILLFGTAIASWMGTTGAAMLLIRLLLKSNAKRKYQVHTVVFFIFLVANIGGSLTPLGDPPLFLGFLQGVPFFWTLGHLFLPLMFMSICLLGIYFVLDTILFNKEGGKQLLCAGNNSETREKFGIEGGQNIILLALVVGSVLFSGMWKPEGGISVFGILIPWSSIVRDSSLVAIAIASMLITSKATRERNDFSWEPFAEVVKLFFGIFLSMIPAIAILKAGESGALAFAIRLVNEGGSANNAAYFWATGSLSGFLDNAPTYLVFLNTAVGTLPAGIANPVDYLVAMMPTTLTAISAGAVFMGALSYIGNAPNFMVRSIAESSGVRMPSFFGYMMWSFGILVPLFIVMTFIFFI